MSLSSNNSDRNADTAGQWYKSAVATSIVGAVFSVIVAGLIVLNYVRVRFDLARQEETLTAMKEVVRDQPDNEGLLSEIRRLDLQIRKVRIHRLRFSQRGTILLLGGVVVTMIALKCVAVFRRRPPRPAPGSDARDRHMHEQWLARWAVATGLSVLCLGALLLVVMPDIKFGEAQTAAPSYPSAEEIARNWPRFRGPGGLGVSAYTDIPTRWDGKTGEGILWKSNVPLPGNNSPVIWDNRVFLSGGDPNERAVYCFDTQTGELVWQESVVAGYKPLEIMEDTGFAAPTVVTDGRRVCAIFATGDVVCFTVEGRKLWEKSLGVPDSMYSYASSLEMYRNLLLIQLDQADAEDEKSRLTALDVFSGSTVWETKRQVGGSWSSPVLIEAAGREQIITCGDPWVIAYEPTSGAELWRAECLSGDIAPSPIYADEKVIAVEPYATLTAIRPDGSGNVTKTHIVWKADADSPDICCPVSNGRLVFLLTSGGLLTSHGTADGKRSWERDLIIDFTASPSLVGNNLYLLGTEGEMHIIEIGPELKESARPELGEECYASPAFADGRIYIRGVEHLYCIGSPN